jgi:hypothetical protein
MCYIVLRCWRIREVVCRPYLSFEPDAEPAIPNIAALVPIILRTIHPPDSRCDEAVNWYNPSLRTRYALRYLRNNDLSVYQPTHSEPRRFRRGR